jgi:hypothetical protein
LVVVAGDIGSPVVVLRERVALLPEGLPRQPYHAVAEQGAAADVIELVVEAAREHAIEAILRAMAGARGRGDEVVGVAIGEAAGGVPDDLERILRSHALLHAAEGRLYREALAEAAAGEGLVVRRFLQRELYSVAGGEIGIGAEALRERVKEMGASLGPPWTSDEKEATAAAWLALAGAGRRGSLTSGLPGA